MRGGYSNQVRIIRNESNLGISKAKQTGIENATGKYIAFIDGDDWFEPQALEKLAIPALKFDLDLVVMNNYRAFPFFNIKREMNARNVNYGEAVYHPECFQQYFINFFGKRIFPENAYWGKLYKRSLLINANFTPPASPIHEDILFNMNMFPLVKSLMFIDYAGYNWRWGGITSGKRNNIYNADQYITRITEIYHLKKRFASKYNYSEAEMPLIWELINHFYDKCSDLAKHSLSNTKSKEIISFIERILKNTAFDDVNKLPKNDYTLPIINKDCNQIYNYCHDRYKSNWKRRIGFNILHHIVYPFSKV